MTAFKGTKRIGVLLVICYSLIIFSSIGLSQSEESVEKKVQRFIKKGDYEGAINMLKRRIRMIDGFKKKKKELAVIYYHLALIYTYVGLDEEVDKNLKLAYQTNPALDLEKDEQNLYFQKKAVKIKQILTLNKKDQPDVKTIKVFDYCSIKIRSSHKDNEDLSFRWFYRSRVIIINREKNQRVFICGGSKGKINWAVDNAVFINDQEIKGCKSRMTVRGPIPEEKKLKPYEITHLIASNQDIKLEIKLADYGILWGNTDIYLVIK